MVFVKTKKRFGDYTEARPAYQPEKELKSWGLTVRISPCFPPSSPEGQVKMEAGT